MTNEEKIYRKCLHCRGTGKVKIRQPYLQTPDTKKMLSIMKRHDLKQLDVAKILDISQAAVHGWFHRKTNLQGKIRSIYFELLKIRGYE